MITDLSSNGTAAPTGNGVVAASRRTLAVPQAHKEHGPIAHALHILLLLVAAAGDAANFNTALGVLLQDQTDLEVATVVAALTAAAVGSMHFVGLSARRLRGAVAGPRQALAIGAFTVLWLGLGVAVFLLRLQLPDTAADLPAGDSFGAPTAAAASQGSGSGTTLFFAVLMLCLYLATGAMAAWGAFNLPVHDPLRASLRRSRRQESRVRRRERRMRQRERRRGLRERRQARAQLRRARRSYGRSAGRLSIAESRWERLQAEVQLLEDDLLRNDDRLAAALAASSAGTMELREHVRVLMSTSMGDPASTNALTGPSPLGKRS